MMTGDSQSQTSSPGALRRYVDRCRKMTERDRRNSRRANYWLFGWMLAFAATIFALKYEVLPTGLPAYLAIAATTALSAVALGYFVHFIREADELQRKIQLEALGIGFAGGFLANFTMALLERVWTYRFDVGDLFIFMVVCYLVGIFLGARRYA